MTVRLVEVLSRSLGKALSNKMDSRWSSRNHDMDSSSRPSFSILKLNVLMFLCDEKMGHQFAMFIKLHVPILFCKDFSGRGEGGESLIYKL